LSASVTTARVRNARVVVTGDRVGVECLAFMSRHGLEVLNPTGHLQQEALPDLLGAAQAYLLAGDELATREVLQRCAGLQVIAFLGTGYQSFIDVDAATEFGIAVTSTPNANTTAVAELTVAHILNSRRQVCALNGCTKGGAFPRTVTRELSGSTVGVIGMGAVGVRTSRMLVDAFGVRILYHSRTRKPTIERELAATAVSLEDLLRTSEIVVLTLTAGPETVNFLTATQLALMRPDAILVNTARASIVDGHALREALTSGVIAAAAFDGYYAEPVPAPEVDEYRLLSLPDEKFVLTPHSAALTDRANERMSWMAARSVVSFFTTGDDDFVTNPGFRHPANARG
jgi:glyoxylate reductase